MVRLAELVEELGGSCALGPDGGPLVRDAHLDSRRVVPGSLFAALAGERQNGARFAGEARRRGAVCVLSSEPVDAGLPNWIHPEARRTFGLAAARVHGNPAQALFVVAVTGTNGKSTTADLCGQLFEHVGRRPAVLGTLGHRLAGGTQLPSGHTTPDAGELQRLLARHREAGGDAIVMEASSHALDQERLAGVEVDVAVFTNLSPEHLDYHRDMETYAAAKERLFAGLGPSSVAVVHKDDPASNRMAAAAAARGATVVTFSAGSRADLTANDVTTDREGTRFFLTGMGVSQGVRTSLLGRFNVENALAATAAVLLSGASPPRVLGGLAAVSSTPGRLESVPTGERGFALYVDYAHTEAALARALDTCREVLAPGCGRLIVVFGCGGDRDPSKRAPMGRAAGRRADLCILTSDNPRGEDPARIAAEVQTGLDEVGCERIVELDRRRAIERAVELARPGDLVLVAGKGHESVQILADRSVPFDDRRVALEALS